MEKKIVICGCTEFGYDVVNHLLINGIKITHIVSLTPEQAKTSKVSGYKSFESLSQKFNLKIFYPNEYSMKNKSDLSFFDHIIETDRAVPNHADIPIKCNNFNI